MCHLPFLQRGVSIISAEEGVFLYLFLIRTAGSFLRHKLCPFHRHIFGCLTIARFKNKTPDKTEGPAGANAG
jgi:hypothetical protein